MIENTLSNLVNQSFSIKNNHWQIKHKKAVWVHICLWTN